MDIGKTNALLGFINIAKSSKGEDYTDFSDLANFKDFRDLLLPLYFQESQRPQPDDVDAILTVTQYLSKRYGLADTWIPGKGTLSGECLTKIALLVMHATMSEGLHAEAAWTNLDTGDQFEIMDMMTSLEDQLDEDGRFKDKNGDAEWDQVLYRPVDIHRLSGHSSCSDDSSATHDSSYGSSEQVMTQGVCDNSHHKLSNMSVIHNAYPSSPSCFLHDSLYTSQSVSCLDVTMMSSCDGSVFSPMFPSRCSVNTVASGVVHFKDSPLQQYMQTPSRKYKTKLRKQEAELRRLRQELLESQLQADEQSEQVPELLLKITELEKELNCVRKQLAIAETNIELLQGFESPGKVKLEQDVKRLSMKNEEMKEFIDINKRHSQDYDDLLHELMGAERDLNEAVNQSKTLNLENVALTEQLKCLKSKTLLEKAETDAILTDKQEQIKLLTDKCDFLESELLLKDVVSKKSGLSDLSNDDAEPPDFVQIEPVPIAEEILHRWNERESFLMSEYQKLMEKYESMAQKCQDLESQDTTFPPTSTDKSDQSNKDVSSDVPPTTPSGTSSTTEVHEVRVKWMLIEKTRYLRSNYLTSSRPSTCCRCSSEKPARQPGNPNGDQERFEKTNFRYSSPSSSSSSSPSTTNYPSAISSSHWSSAKSQRRYSPNRNSIIHDPAEAESSADISPLLLNSSDPEQITVPEIAKVMNQRWPGGKVFLAIFQLLACLMGFGDKNLPKEDGDVDLAEDHFKLD